ncbi:hypothetical protein DFP72DRAFT_1010790 [Ephemerocybe angulata]|uniref:Uncharacterized protein n=1 Tax=Ephemerocybe angulata TaxID=980116 RepID=A0A8H6HWQ6_9AGAR|nr:hypothetical protein DFP72DRAFT_1010790 [Tulosesus angulatus]
MFALVEGRVFETPLMTLSLSPTPTHNLTNSKLPWIFGGGLGHLSFPTQATHTLLTCLADLVLSDKLVPDTVLALILTPIGISDSEKIPGNAEGAQMEMMRRPSRLQTLNQGNPDVVGGRVGRRTPHPGGVSSVLAPPLPTTPRRSTTLMAIVHLAQVVDAFVASDGGARREGGSYTGNTMVAIIERASMVIMSTLRHSVRAGET